MFWVNRSGSGVEQKGAVSNKDRHVSLSVRLFKSEKIQQTELCNLFSHLYVQIFQVLLQLHVRVIGLESENHPIQKQTQQCAVWIFYRSINKRCTDRSFQADQQPSLTNDQKGTVTDFHICAEVNRSPKMNEIDRCTPSIYHRFPVDMQNDKVAPRLKSVLHSFWFEIRLNTLYTTDKNTKKKKERPAPSEGAVNSSHRQATSKQASWRGPKGTSRTTNTKTA